MNDIYQNCENTFFRNGPYFHIYTTPPGNDLLFVSDADFKEATNIIALASTGSGGKNLAYAIMSNHLHCLMAADRERCMACIENLRRRIGAFLRRNGKRIPSIEFHIVEISSLKQLRDEIAYIIRNPYTARADVNPFAYRWCTGYLYFNEMLKDIPAGTPAQEVPILVRRAIKHERNQEMEPTLRILDGMILPQSFVDYRLAMSLFENARQFVWWVTRNVEAYTATAARLGERKVLSDEEAYLVAITRSKADFGVDKPSLLPLQQKNSLLRSLKYEYGANNKQLARCAGVPIGYINELFPLSAPIK